MGSQAGIIFTFLFLAVLGACIGSFLNVVICRLPAGESLILPRSRCPRCHAGLKWFENVPVFAWLFLRGRCRHCGQPISVQYLLIEALCALLFVILYCTYYHTWLNESFRVWHAGPVRWPGWARQLTATGAVYAVHLVLVAGLLAATVIDARHYIIPLSIPWLVSIVAAVVLPVYAHLFPRIATGGSDPLVPVAATGGVHLAAGAMVGLVLALLLLLLKLLPRSFDDEEAEALDAISQVDPGPDQSQAADAQASPPDPQQGTDGTLVTGLRAARIAGAEASSWAGPLDAVQAMHAAEGTDQQVAADDQSSAAADRAAPSTDAADEGHGGQAPPPQRQVEAFLSYSHPRREVLKEGLFVAVPVIWGLAAWWHLANAPLIFPAYPAFVRVLGGVCLGYLIGGGLVWLTRILGTLAFGREAMGLGDVHLLAAIGAVLGAKAAVIVFFIAPFLGLVYVAVAVGVGRVLKGQVRIIPFGPYLALAALVLLLAHEPIIGFVLKYFFF